MCMYGCITSAVTLIGITLRTLAGLLMSYWYLPMGATGNIGKSAFSIFTPNGEAAPTPRPRP